jgi:RNA polymerase sigma-70 factor (ECF subfamily)
MAVIDTLPELQQTLLRLRHMQGMEMKELASLFQMNEAAVRKALSRARMTVRKQYLIGLNDESKT